MEGRSGSGNGGERERVPREEVLRWAENLSNPTDRESLYNYLESRILKDAKKMLELWKMCDTFLIKQR
jgi:hypothetical protein